MTRMCFYLFHNCFLLRRVSHHKLTNKFCYNVQGVYCFLTVNNNSYSIEKHGAKLGHRAITIERLGIFNDTFSIGGIEMSFQPE